MAIPPFGPFSNGWPSDGPKSSVALGVEANSLCNVSWPVVPHTYHEIRWPDGATSARLPISMVPDSSYVLFYALTQVLLACHVSRVCMHSLASTAASQVQSAPGEHKFKGRGMGHRSTGISHQLQMLIAWWFLIGT